MRKIWICLMIAVCLTAMGTPKGTFLAAELPGELPATELPTEEDNEPEPEEINAKLLWKIKRAEDRELVEVSTGENVTINSATIKAAKDQGVCLSITSRYRTTVTWRIDHIIGTRNFDPAVETGVSLEAIENALKKASLSNSLKLVQVHFAQSGGIPGTADLTIDLKDEYNFKKGETLHLYYFNPETELFERVDSATCKSGYVVFVITHCSDYIIVNERLPKVLTDAPPETQDTENTEDTEHTEESETSETGQETEDPEEPGIIGSDTEDVGWVRPPVEILPAESENTGNPVTTPVSEEEEDFSEENRSELMKYLGILGAGLVCMIGAVVAVCLKKRSK